MLYNSASCGFDDRAMREWLATRRMLNLWPHFFMIEGQPAWTVLVEARTLAQGERPDLR
jgi:hypothetical protein